MSNRTEYYELLDGMRINDVLVEVGELSYKEKFNLMTSLVEIAIDIRLEDATVGVNRALNEYKLTYIDKGNVNLRDITYKLKFLVKNEMEKMV